MKTKAISKVVFFSIFLFGCGGGTPSDSEVTLPPSNVAPTADAGPDQSVDEQSIVTLSGSATDSDGSIASYSWSQTSGYSVFLSDQTSNTPSFTSPFVTATTYLSFELTVTDNEDLSATDFVDIVINPVGTIIHVPEDFLTIGDAINSAAPGDKVILNTGIHTVTSAINIDKDLVIASAFIYTQNQSDIISTIIRGDRLNNLLTVTNGANVRIEGLTIENTRKSITIDVGHGIIRHNVLRDNLDSISFEGNSSGVVEFNEIISSRDDGIDIDGLRGPYIIRGNIIRDSRDDGMEFRMIGSYLVTGKIKYEVYDNIIDGAGGDGIQLIDYPEDSQNRREINIHNNYIKNVMFAGIGTMPDTMTIRTELSEIYPNFVFMERVFVTNNTIINNDNGISGGDNFIVINNIIADNRLGVTNIDGTSILDYTMFFNNNLSDIPSSVQGGNIIFDDPILTSDGSLTFLSPSIDAGVSSYTWQNEVVLDIKKFNGVSPDLGWVEFIGL